jgi:hypothetical protein
MIAECVPEWQAISGLILCSVGALATGIALGITISVWIQEKKEKDD